MKDALNCPNCGAPIAGEKCPYCGAVFLDFAAIQVGAPSYVKFKIGNTYLCTRLVVESLDVHPQCHTATITNDLGIIAREVVTGWSCDIHMDAHAVYTPGEPMVTIIEKE